MRLLVGRLIAVVAIAATPCSLAAQARPIRVDGVKGLTFGVLLGGLPMSIARNDPVRAGQFNLSAQPKSPIILQLTLPSAMTGPAGATIPLVFGGGDAGFSAQESISNQQAFDPRASAVVITNASNGRGSVYLGGTAQPAANQRPGSYTGTITLTVTYP